LGPTCFGTITFWFHNRYLTLFCLDQAQRAQQEGMIACTDCSKVVSSKNSLTNHKSRCKGRPGEGSAASDVIRADGSFSGSASDNNDSGCKKKRAAKRDSQTMAQFQLLYQAAMMDDEDNVQIDTSTAGLSSPKFKKQCEQLLHCRDPQCERNCRARRRDHKKIGGGKCNEPYFPCTDDESCGFCL